MTDRVIVAEDNDLQRSYLEQIIPERYDAEVDAVADGQTLVELVRANQYTLIITDYSMPLKDKSMPAISGLDAIRQIKTDKPDVPIILMSGQDPSFLSERALTRGVTHYVDKQTLPGALWPILDLYLTKR